MLKRILHKTLFFTYFILFLIILLGLILRIHNLSPFLLYPDSYQNLIVAQNIAAYHSVVGFLGVQGIVYPDYFMWTRPFYPLLIVLFSEVFQSSQSNAQFISMGLGVIAIPVVFFFLSSLWQSKWAGLAGAFLLAVSFNHTIWSGFVMTETSGVFCMLLFLWTLFSISKTKKQTRQIVLAALIFALAVLARYEYIFLLFPILLFLFYKTSKQLVLLFISIAIVLWTAIGWMLYPSETIQTIIVQQPAMLLMAGILVGIVSISVLIYHWLKKKKQWLTIIRDKIPNLLIGIISIVLGFIILFGVPVTAGIRSFILHDLLVTLFSFIGIILLLHHKIYRHFAYFVVSCIFLLGTIYAIVNPAMERYMTHLLPFFIIPASYGLLKTCMFIRDRRLALRLCGIGFIFILVVYQIMMTYQGLRSLNDPSWFAVSYEEQSAKMLKKYLQSGDLLVVSMPEPYYFFTGASTVSVADAKPYLYVPSTLDHETVVVVDDIGMRTYFPEFSTLLQKSLKEYKFVSYPIAEQFHYSDKDRKDSKMVIVYRLKLGTLRHKIASY
ncbi:MAG: glycosyltransferase family 39 protein [Candidatus Levyibacteriota bacterium]